MKKNQQASPALLPAALPYPEAGGFESNPGFILHPIAYVRTPFHDRFGVPRQPGLADKIEGLIQFQKNDEVRAALEGLQKFSHAWVIFMFHAHGANRWKPTIRPPRLGGKEKVGVLSSRSPHRPNPIGISVFKILEICADSPTGAWIRIAGADLVDGTPVLDIKPYLPYADSIQDASSGWANESIQFYNVNFSDEAEEFLNAYNHSDEFKSHVQCGSGLKDLIIDVLKLDPRPAFQKRDHPIEDPRCDGQIYGIKLMGLDIHWKIDHGSILVMLIKRL